MPDIPTGRYNHGCEIIDTENGEELWVIGGYNSRDFYYALDSVEVYNFELRQWSTGVPLPGKRTGLSTVVVDNNIIVIGGEDGDNVQSNIWEWNPASNNWKESEVGLDGPRSFFGAILVDERSGVTCT